MAQKVIGFPIALKQNQNTYSSAYGKWYWFPFWPKTLSLRGLIERVAFDQSVYSRDIVEGVIQKLTTVMIELLKSGQPVKWDGLGTFTVTIENDSAKAAGTWDTATVDQIKGVHITFIPENAKGEKLTSRAFRDLCTFEPLGVLQSTNVGTTAKPKYVRRLITFEAMKHDSESSSSQG